MWRLFYTVRNVIGTLVVVYRECLVKRRSTVSSIFTSFTLYIVSLLIVCTDCNICVSLGFNLFTIPDTLL